MSKPYGKPDRIVVALGGNALGNTPVEQLGLVQNTARHIVDMIEEGTNVVVSHGNGPQVGMINLAMEFSANKGGGTPFMPFPECGAMSQGYIGYHLQQGIGREMHKRYKRWHAATVVTQIECDPDDPAFKNPTKPIGPFYTEEQAKEFMAEDPSKVFVEDSGRGWRRVVASPDPKKIVEADSILNLLDNEFIVIACGGGGIPVVRDYENKGCYKGVPAVIDKDLGGELLADLESLVGSITEKQLLSMYFDKAFVGANGYGEQGVFTYDLREARKKEIVKEQSRIVYLLADTSKENKRSFARAFGLDACVLITEKDAGQEAESDTPQG